MDGKVKILGFAGSLRKDSYNKALLRAAYQLLPPDAELETFDLEGIPPFNQDIEKKPPARVVEFKERIRIAHAILIATPEYNYSLPGVLKNAIDWASRPYGDSAFTGKVAAVMGASIGMIGTARAQYDLRRSFVFLNVHVVNQPEVMVPFAADKFTHDGELTDPVARDLVGKLLAQLVALARKLGTSGK